MGGLLPIWSAENHLVVQERSKSLGKDLELSYFLSESFSNEF